MPTKDMQSLHSALEKIFDTYDFDDVMNAIEPFRIRADNIAHAKYQAKRLKELEEEHKALLSQKTKLLKELDEKYKALSKYQALSSENKTLSSIASDQVDIIAQLQAELAKYKRG